MIHLVIPTARESMARHRSLLTGVPSPSRSSRAGSRVTRVNRRSSGRTRGRTVSGSRRRWRHGRGGGGTEAGRAPALGCSGAGVCGVVWGRVVVVARTCGRLRLRLRLGLRRRRRRGRRRCCRRTVDAVVVATRAFTVSARRSSVDLSAATAVSTMRARKTHMVPRPAATTGTVARRRPSVRVAVVVVAAGAAARAASSKVVASRSRFPPRSRRRGHLRRGTPMPWLSIGLPTAS